MPKVLILVVGDSESSKALAKCVGDGAAAVRFTEVDIRAVESRAGGDFSDYDGIVVASAEGGVSSALARLVDASESSDFAHTVIATAVFDDGGVLEQLARLGGIIVAERPSDLAPEARARLVGKRVAKVAGWVRHALSHDHHDHRVEG